MLLSNRLLVFEVFSSHHVSIYIYILVLFAFFGDSCGGVLQASLIDVGIHFEAILDRTAHPKEIIVFFYQNDAKKKRRKEPVLA